MNQEKNPIVRILVCGSVDDGKSTLIGRLLMDSKSLTEDQILSVKQSKHTHGELNLAMFTDGLEEEREKGITIDVAYRYFSTPDRKYILIDAPGHREFTRNMVTGATQADVAIVLVDPTKIEYRRLLPQTIRHLAIAHEFNLPIVVGVNKMDMFGIAAAETFETIRNIILESCALLDIHVERVVPISGLEGWNVFSHSEKSHTFMHSYSTLMSAASNAVRSDVDEPFYAVVRGMLTTMNFGKQRFLIKVLSGSIQPLYGVVDGYNDISLTKYSLPVDSLSKGESGEIQYTRNYELPHTGSLIKNSSSAIRTKTFSASVCCLRGGLVVGNWYTFKYAGQSNVVRLVKIYSKLDVEEARWVDVNEDVAEENDIFHCVMESQLFLDIELRSYAPEISRFILYSSNDPTKSREIFHPCEERVVAAGMVVG